MKASTRSSPRAQPRRAGGGMLTIRPRRSSIVSRMPRDRDRGRGSAHDEPDNREGGIPPQPRDRERDLQSDDRQRGDAEWQEARDRRVGGREVGAAGADRAQQRDGARRRG